MECVFCKIANGSIPKEFLYQDADLMVFPDIHPARPVHILIVPKKHISEFMAVEDHDLFKKIGHVMQKMIKEQNLEKRGHRIIINGGGAQEVDHLHVHLMGPIQRP
ncbi:MAG: HIT domain-containing protein [Candidatus Levybacteria bacterium]|nr:HIT domain-containing protein [Candidatus Levybacteria bacterium]